MKRREFLKKSIAGSFGLASSAAVIGELSAAPVKTGVSENSDFKSMLSFADEKYGVLVDEFKRLKEALTTPKKRVTLQISWRKENAGRLEVAPPNWGVFLPPSTEQCKIKDAYDKLYSTSGLVFTHYRSQAYKGEYEEMIPYFRGELAVLRIGVNKLCRYGSSWCVFDTDDATAYERAVAHFAKHNEYNGEKMAFVCILDESGYQVDGNGNKVSFEDHMGFIIAK